MERTEQAKHDVAEFWDRASCGEVYAQGDSRLAKYESQARERYALEPFLPPFARFEEGAGRDVLEIGVGMGADHLEWARRRPRRLVGLDLTSRAVEHTRSRLELYGFAPEVEQGDAERLPFSDASFDIVYSWGVLHHSPDTPRAVREVARVLRPGGTARVMIYHRYSLVGLLLWIRYALLRGRPFTSLDAIYARYLESPGTKAYSAAAAGRLFREAGFTEVRTQVQLSNGDLLTGAAGQRHEGRALELLRRVWPRPLVRAFGRRLGLFLLIEARR
jgi:ubiquinone/menaquinone biosynthesis C-methylase UbiE